MAEEHSQGLVANVKCAVKLLQAHTFRSQEGVDHQSKISPTTEQRHVGPACAAIADWRG